MTSPKGKHGSKHDHTGTGALALTSSQLPQTEHFLMLLHLAVLFLVVLGAQVRCSITAQHHKDSSCFKSLGTRT